MAPAKDEFLTKLRTIQELWQLFRSIFDQREEPHAAPQLEAADLVAADCYFMCMEQARSWGVIAESQLRGLH